MRRDRGVSADLPGKGVWKRNRSKRKKVEEKGDMKGKLKFNAKYTQKGEPSSAKMACDEKYWRATGGETKHHFWSRKEET
jgi:hypothetical protein